MDNTQNQIDSFHKTGTETKKIELAQWLSNFTQKQKKTQAWTVLKMTEGFRDENSVRQIKKILQKKNVNTMVNKYEYGFDPFPMDSKYGQFIQGNYFANDFVQLSMGQQ